MITPRSNNRTLLLLLMVLLVTNGIMLFLLTKKEEKPKEPQLSRSERMIKRVQEELALDSAQVKQYLALRAHRDSTLNPVQREMREKKNAMMQLLRVDSLPKDSLMAAAKKIGESQALIELEYFNHFKRMMQMLKPEQQPKFDSLLYRMVNPPSSQDNSGRQGQK